MDKVRLIDANALLAGMDMAVASGSRHVVDDLFDAVHAAPTVDAEPVRRGKWIDEPERLGRSHGTFKRCSVCGDGRWNGWSTDSLYCGTCGARMSEKEDA